MGKHDNDLIGITNDVRSIADSFERHAAVQKENRKRIAIAIVGAVGGGWLAAHGYLPFVSDAVHAAMGTR